MVLTARQFPWYLGPVSQKTRNLTGPKSYFEISVKKSKVCLTSNKVHFVSLTDNITVQFSNLLKLSSRMESKTA